MVINKIRALFFLICLLNITAVSAKTSIVGSLKEYNERKNVLVSGDTLIWRNGLYNDIKLTIKTNGLVIMAEVPGKVIFSGSSSVILSADSLIFSGFQFIDGSITNDVLTVEGSKNIVSNINISGYTSHYYFHITTLGRYNTIEYCNFEEKHPAPPGKEGTSIFQVAVDSINPGYNIIRFCSFKNHIAPRNSGGDYGMEALRIGYSFQSKFISRTIVEYCFFTRCNGDGEIISNKARENIIRYNTFIDNGASHLTLRHGSNNSVYGNFFLNGAGIRIKEGGTQMVYNNYFSTGRFFSISLENYHVDPLKDILITNNTFVRSGTIKLGATGDFKPEMVHIRKNLFISPAGMIFENSTGKEKFQNNVICSATKKTDSAGFYKTDIVCEMNQFGFYQPKEQIPVEDSVVYDVSMLDIPILDDDSHINSDIAGNERPGPLKTAGCFEPVLNARSIKLYASSEQTGPSYLRNEDGQVINSLSEFCGYTYKQVDTIGLKLFVKKPQDFDDKICYPAIIFFFGGGWNSGNITQFRPHAEYFASRGMVTVLADYRVKNRHNTSPFDAVSDAKSAIRYLRKNFELLNIDTSAIVASGGSAGGHLAAAAATISGLDDPEDDLSINARPDVQVLFNPVFDNGPSGYGYERIGNRYTEISPIHNIRKGIPPAIVFLGTNDRLIPVETARLYKQRMEEEGSRCDLFLYDGQPHGFFNYRKDEDLVNPYFIKTVRETDIFLRSIGFLKGDPEIDIFIKTVKYLII